MPYPSVFFRLDLFLLSLPLGICQSFDLLSRLISFYDSTVFVPPGPSASYRTVYKRNHLYYIPPISIL